MGSGAGFDGFDLNRQALGGKLGLEFPKILFCLIDGCLNKSTVIKHRGHVPFASIQFAPGQVHDNRIQPDDFTGGTMIFLEKFFDVIQ